MPLPSPSQGVYSPPRSNRVHSNSRTSYTVNETVPSEGEAAVAVFNVPTFLPLGIGRNVHVVATQVQRSGGTDAGTFIKQVQRSAFAGKSGQPSYLGLVVSHPTDPQIKALVFGRIPAHAADRIRLPEPTITPSDTPIEWIPVSDERPTLTTRRDSSRPAAHLARKSIELWGCGGLGSWIAELCARTGPSKITLRDHGQVHGGHLVRQNYTEDDIGQLKITALAKRLRLLGDSTIVEGGVSVTEALAVGLPGCDLIIDATISETVAHRLDGAARALSGTGPLLVQVATDRRSATLGLIIVASPSCGIGPATVDRALASRVLEDETLEAFHTFWTPPVEGGELLPAPGCSVPTYHGSAADLAAIAGAMVSVIGQQVASPVIGAHLIASPHSGCQPAWRFIQHEGR